MARMARYVGAGATDADPGKRDLDPRWKGSFRRQGQSQLIESPFYVHGPQLARLLPGTGRLRTESEDLYAVEIP